MKHKLNKILELVVSTSEDIQDKEQEILQLKIDNRELKKLSEK